ncbi:MAG: hypothetical protein WCA49_24510 [Candidatus Sulfotelmatobacter sp.]
MRRNRQRAVWLLGVSILGVLILSPVLLGQTVPAPETAVPVPTDWSHSHVIFSKPATAEQAARVQQDPRYWQQRYRSELPVLLPPAESREAAPELRGGGNVAPRGGNLSLGGDWQENLGSGGSVGAGNYPAKFSLRGATANCGNTAQPDFVVYSTGLEGSATQASIVAYDNIYSGCTGTVPSVYWAYNTGGQILTSPVYSQDGTQLAFVQTNAGLEGNLVLLKWVASTTETVGTPKTLTPISAGLYGTCSTPPCMTTILLTNLSGTAANDTVSSAFYDYAHDVAWVGDNHGWLHKFTPVFLGTPFEVRTGGWPVQVNPTNPNVLSDPVHDSASGNVFVGDAGGYLYLVNATGGVTKSGQLDFGVGIVQGPVVDSTAGLVYVFASSDGTANCAGGAACAAIDALTTTFAAGAVGSRVEVGTSVVYGTLPNPNPLYIGAFDSTYQNSVNATGDIYVCGDTGVDPILYRVPIAAGVFGTVASVAAVTPAADKPACSPVTDVFNANASGGAAERLFFGVENFAHPTLCAAKGCALSFVDMPWKASTPYKVGQEILVLRPPNNTLYINVVTVPGTSAATPPAGWTNVVGGTTVSGTVTFMNQGATTVTALANWTANHAYGLRARIVDSNGDVEIVSVAGRSNGTAPTWSTTAGATTTDGTVTWVNAGVLPSAALAAAGGTSGFIIDNTLGNLTGDSQVYFSTLSNQTCTTSGTTGGCAVQASQSALK